ncbi:hypothetical protein EGW08_009478 [Elysia chlorotica]|uniref:SOCS box domain-containing protein n=1 Tax=Elysia chlorotica TaxID=188477 RepID=A0A433TME4_ELYCH|nr:hypothetical protein EGW08_009478 [Elysia chlorotica]
MSRTLEEPHVTCQVWDTAGMERYRALLPHYMRQARCAVIVYDVSNRDSFDSVKNYWLDFVESCGEEGLVKVLVGNKMDVSERLRAVNTEEGAQLARSRDMLFIETSAKFELKVDDLFIAAARKVLASPRPPDLSDSLGPECPVIKLDRSRSKRNLGCFGMLRMVFK